jgi:hypothetical protein
MAVRAARQQVNESRLTGMAAASLQMLRAGPSVDEDDDDVNSDDRWLADGHGPLRSDDADDSNGKADADGDRTSDEKNNGDGDPDWERHDNINVAALLGKTHNVNANIA